MLVQAACAVVLSADDRLAERFVVGGWPTLLFLG
jgi:hypothetical protein